MSCVQLILKDALWWSEAIGAFVESRDAYGVDELEMGNATELFGGVPTTFSALRSMPGDSAIRIYGPSTLEDFFEAPVKLRLTRHGRWSVGLQLKWDGGMYEQRLEFAWDGNVAVPLAARTATETAAGETAPLPDSELRELYLAGIRAHTEGNLERTIELWQRILEQDSQFQGGSLTIQLERIRRQFQPTQILQLRERARNARKTGAWAEEIGAWQALLGLEAADEEARTSIPIAEANRRYAWMYENASQLLRKGLLPDARTQLDILWQQHPDYGDPAGLAQQADFVRLRLRSSRGRYTYLTSNGRERRKDVYLTVVSQDLQGNLTARVGHSDIGAQYLCTGTIKDDRHIVLQGKHEQVPQQIAFEGNIRPDGRGQGTIEISTHEATINTGKWEIDGLVNSLAGIPAAP
jgi:hypothetical protein